MSRSRIITRGERSSDGARAGAGLVAAGWLWLAMILPAHAQATLHTLFTNGPTANRINVVVLAEGYTTNQLGQFLADAGNALNSLLDQPPYHEYPGYFNGYGIFVPSADPGSDHPLAGSYRNTYFNSSFDTGGINYYLTIPPNTFDANYANGQGKVDALLAALMPACDLALMVVNDLEYGGSGGDTLITSLNLASPEIALHESGHTFGGLADEYDYGAPPGFVPAEMPNATALTNRSLIKWAAWISTNTPLPTPAAASNAAVVGLFRGAQYQSNDWYRPKLDCKMRTLGVPFCEVCSEQLVKSIYTRVRPVDAFSPAATNFPVYSPLAVSFSVTPLQPLTHNLAVQWYTNSLAVGGATNPAFTLQPAALGHGTHTVRVVVSDPTPLVRNDPVGLLKQTNTWTLNVSLTDLALVSAQYLAGDRFRLTVTGTAPQGFVLQSSTNLADWTPLLTNSLAGGRFDYTNLNLTHLPRRFYRAVSPP
jgi:hypothetical protein